MKQDCSIIKVQSNLDESNELEHELNLLGLRTSSKEIESLTNLQKEIELSLIDSSSVILLLNSSVIESLIIANINKIDSHNKKAIFILFKLTKEENKKIDINENNKYVSKSQSLEKLAIEIFKKVLSDSKREITFSYNNSISQVWKSPIYIFKKIEDYDTERKILVDVTWSSKPTRPDLAPALKSALRKTIEAIKKEKCKILDFGAGKLRHSVFLLQKGHSVTAVDFESIYVRPSPQIQGYLDETESFKNFNQIVYPWF